MKNFLHKKGWGADTNPAHFEPHPIPLVKETSTRNPDGDYVKLNLHRYTMSSTSDLYEFRMSLLDHGEPEEFLLFVQNLQMNLSAKETLETEARVQYICTLVHGEVLLQFELLYADVKI